ncbi:amino acid racemase [Shewanella olleyana]|uniref:aspartate/glutamate racemase family protein n=1 Tax=Shewanella olleyana TaxID=135626 RepID=UPI00200D166A|nr:amino acid racemase [Shewanella olleyana]MCL1068298.1 amino acid racemase [Shewanella olleyana]
MKDLIFGVIGNMGPQADILFQDILFKEEVANGALKDQQHMGMLVIKNPDIPDLSAAINEGGEDPIPELLESIKFLERNHVHFAVITSNTAHYFRNTLQPMTGVYLLDMLQATTEKIKQENPQAIVGVLSSNETYFSGIFDRYLDDAKLSFYKPNLDVQERYVHSAIYGALSGEKLPCGEKLRTSFGINEGKVTNNIKLIAKAIETLVAQGTDTIILGCSELRLVRGQLQDIFQQIDFVDPMEIIAEKVVKVYEAAKILYLNNPSPAEIERVNLIDIHSVDDIAHYIVSKAKAHLASLNP